MKLKFLGRQSELDVLNNLWNSKNAEFLILYGRQRVGKTALLTEWMQRTPQRSFYWVASPTSSTAQLRAFSQAVYNFANPNAPAPDTFTFASWEQAFQQVGTLAEKERLALLIDDFTYLLKVVPGIAGRLQNLWDHLLSKRSLFLCLSGSHLGIIKREFISGQAPLYGRASAQLYLQPFLFASTHLFFPRYSAIDRVAIYTMFGGVPAYWERIDPSKSLSQNIRLQLLTPNNLLQAEARLLLQDYVSVPHNYIAILSAISFDAHTVKEIGAAAGLPSGHITKYLSVLTDTGFVERRTPATEEKPSHAGRYHITDPYMRFYFRFLASRQDQLALGIQDQALAEISKHMIDFIGKYTWEELCREWTLRAGAAGELPYLPDKVGSAWNTAAQVDVVGINSMQKTLILGECKWTTAPNDRISIADLIEEKAPKIVPNRGKWKVFFLGFSRGGWTAGAIAYQNQINQRPVAGSNWVSTGMRLVELDQLDQDLKRWTR